MTRTVQVTVIAGVAGVLSACLSTGFDEPLAPPPEAEPMEAPAVRVEVDEERSEVRIVAGPFHVPAGAPATETGGGHAHGGHHAGHAEMRTPLIPVRWPVDGGLQGMRLGIYDGEGRSLPRDVIHHLIGVNHGRRQLVYPVSERLFGFGTETPDVRIPDFLEIPLDRGDSLGFYAMWNNTSGADLHGVTLQLVLPFAGGTRDREAVMPFYVDANNQIGGATTFDVPPGRSERSFEFTVPAAGGLLAAGGHLHDYGREVRIEDARTGEVLVRLESERDADGTVHAVEQKVFRRLFGLLDARVELEAGRQYRLVGVYQNPTGDVILDGGMAHIVGLFAPRDPEAWPTIQANAPDYQRDASTLPRPLEARTGVRP